MSLSHAQPMPDEVVDQHMACAVQAEARRMWRVVGWLVFDNHPDHPGKFVARLLSGHASPYLLVSDSLADLRSRLPPGLVRQPVQPRDAIELWFVM